MWRGLIVLAMVLGLAALAGCGGGAPQPEEEIAHAYQRVEAAEGDLVLAEVEYAQAGFREAPEAFAGDSAKIAKVQRGDVEEAHHLQRECHEGNGLESCDSIEAIEDVVDDLDREAHEAARSD